MLSPALINRNMRCIEISLTKSFHKVCYTINRNMRCIEMQLHQPKTPLTTAINRNMRCIEISRNVAFKF